MTEEDRKVIAHMRARVEQCRRLAEALTDKGASAVLLKMAEEAEADIARLEDRDGDGDGDEPNPMPSPPSAE